MNLILPASAILLNTGLAISAEQTPVKSSPNVLFIAVDDLRTELGCYGIKDIKTPNIDKLAASGVVFTHHFAQVPTCGASRASLLTGRRPSKSGGLANHALTSGPSKLKADIQPGAQSFPELFKRSGYQTVLIGKISHMPDGKVFAYNGAGDGRPELPNAWSEFATPYGKWKYGHGCFFAYGYGHHREDGKSPRLLMQFPDVKDNELPDGMMADTAIKKLGELKGKPFMMALGFFKPHLPFVAPKKYHDLYQDIDVKPTSVPEIGSSKYWASSGEFYSYKMNFNKTKPLALEDQIKVKKAYYACVSYVDAQIGRVLDKLKSTGLDKNTIVVLWGDHGWNLGEHAIWGKHNLLERALRSPLIVRDPRIGVTGKSDAIVETLDIYPTLVDLCNPSFTKTCHPLDGISFKSVLQDPTLTGKNAAISYWGKGRSVRSGQYRLIATKRKKKYSNIELYDHLKDPEEEVNIANQEKEVRDRLLDLLKADQPVVMEDSQ